MRRWINRNSLAVLVLLLVFGYSGLTCQSAFRQVDRVEAGKTFSSISLALEQYARDNDDRLPPMNSVSVVSGALAPYQPGNFHPPHNPEITILPNPNLSYVKTKRLPNGGRNTVTFYELRSQPDGTRWVAYWDYPDRTKMELDYGPLRSVSRAEWDRIKTVQGIH